MSLSKQDLADIRSVVLDALDTVVNPRFDRVEAQLDEHTATLAEHTAILNEHTATLNGHTAILNEHGRRLTAIENRLGDVEDRLKALENDVKELYAMVGRSGDSPSTKRFAKLTPEQQLRHVYADVRNLAGHMGVEL